MATKNTKTHEKSRNGDLINREREACLNRKDRSFDRELREWPRKFISRKKAQNAQKSRKVAFDEERLEHLFKLYEEMTQKGKLI